MERRPPGPENNISYLERLRLATLITPEQPRQRSLSRRSQRPQRPLRKLDGLDYIPSLDIDLPNNINTSEMFVMLVEGVKKYKLADKNVKARRIMSSCLQLARSLDDELPGDDEGVKFFVQGLDFLEEVNPGLAEDVSRIMQKVYDEKMFSKRR